jgi:hypothetical protein
MAVPEGMRRRPRCKRADATRGRGGWRACTSPTQGEICAVPWPIRRELEEEEVLDPKGRDGVPAACRLDEGHLGARRDVPDEDRPPQVFGRGRVEPEIRAETLAEEGLGLVYGVSREPRGEEVDVFGEGPEAVGGHRGAADEDDGRAEGLSARFGALGEDPDGLEGVLEREESGHGGMVREAVAGRRSGEPIRGRR